MPKNILAKVFDSLDGKDLVSVSRTSNRMKGVADTLSAANMKKMLGDNLPKDNLPLIDAIRLGEVKGIVPSAAINRHFHHRPRSDPLPPASPPNEVAAQIRAMHGDLF